MTMLSYSFYEYERSWFKVVYSQVEVRGKVIKQYVNDYVILAMIIFCKLVILTNIRLRLVRSEIVE